MDITLRRLADRYYLIKRTLLPWLAIVRPIHVRIGIDEQTKQIQDQYVFDVLPSFVWLPRYWHLFDSWDAPALPDKEFRCSGFGTVETEYGNRQLKELRRILIARHKREARAALASRLRQLLRLPAAADDAPAASSLLNKKIIDGISHDIT